MARTVTKSLASATIYVLNPAKKFEIDENGMPIANVTFQCDGNPTPNKARILAEKYCNAKNVMVLNIEVDETKLNVSPDTFIANSHICEPDKPYGREYVTQTFKVTKIGGFYIDPEKGMQTFVDYYNGVTTESKLLRFVRDLFGMQAVISTTEVFEERRYMTREKYLELAR